MTCGAVGERAQVILMWVRAPDVGNASHPWRLRVTRVWPWVMCSSWREDYRMLKNTSIRGLAMRYDNLSGALSWDNALEHQWHGSGSRDCRGLNMHNFSIFAQMGLKRIPSASTWDVHDDEVVTCEYQRSYKEVILLWSCLGLPTPLAKGKCLLGPKSW